MTRSNPTADRLRTAREVLILGMACLSPWAIGGVDAWAQAILFAGLVLVALLGLFQGGAAGWQRRVFGLPSVALAALAGLALFQAVALPAALERTIAPATHAWRAGLVPSGPQGVLGGTRPGSLVGPPIASLSHDPDASFRTAAQLAAAWLLFQGVLGLGRGAGPLRRFSLVTVANACVLTVFAIVQALAWEGKVYGVRATPTPGRWITGGPFVSHNHLAAYLNIAFGLVLGFLLTTLREQAQEHSRTEPGRRRAPGTTAALWAGYAAGLVLVGMIASHSRGGCVALVVATAVSLLILRDGPIRPRLRLRLRLGSGLGVMLGVIVLFLVAIGSASPFERLASIPRTSLSGFNGRGDAWSLAIRTWKAFPVWGTGLGSFPAATSAFYLRDFQDIHFSHAESEYLQMLTEGGLVGVGIALVALAAIVRLGRRALIGAQAPQDRTLVLGALTGGLALLIQCVSDFPLHIPAVAISALILAGHLYRMGLEAHERDLEMLDAAPARSRPPRFAPALGGVAMVALSVLLAVAGLSWARAEAFVRGAGLPFPGSRMPSVDALHLSTPELTRMRSALEAALRLRPDWAEGYIRLGTTLLGLYSNRAAELIAEVQEQEGAPGDPAAVAILSDPLWLHSVVHSASREELDEAGGLLDQEPVRDYLIPAARCFLEARRCSPDLAVPHARLATLDYLLDPAEPASRHAVRALRLAGYDYLALMLAGQAAAQAGDRGLAAQCWRKSLAIHDPGAAWKEITWNLSQLFTPDEILQQIVPPGARFPLMLADQFYTAPEWREPRELCLRTALQRLPDESLEPLERQWLEAEIRSRLGQSAQARKLMAEALRGDSSHPDWRAGFIASLVAWGEPEEAARQARIGMTLHPDHPGIQRAARSALDALAQGPAPSAGAH
jgi:O-antigen ligase/tetratricopeptide (TPR) repeat protein